MIEIVEHDDGTIEYVLNGKTHRSNGPATTIHSTCWWYLYDNIHMYYGPANDSTHPGSGWWIHGDYIGW